MPVFYSAVVAYGCSFDCREEVATECVSLSLSLTKSGKRNSRDLNLLEKVGQTELGSKS
jgi:hypothetical protein